MRVGVTGATGFVGRAVVAALATRGDSVTVLSRDPSRAVVPSGVRVLAFDVNNGAPNPEPLEDLDAIVHLAGEIIGERWTPRKKRAIYDSRVGGTRNLVASLAACSRRPRILVTASGVGYYGDRGDEPVDEASSAGDDFLAGVCVGWEREAQAATKLGMRVASLRTGLVFGSDGGALARLLPIFRSGVGGPLGSGRQWTPWVHLEDAAALYCFLLDRDDISGPVCAVAPDYATNRRFALALGRAVQRPALVPAPALALRAALGEFADSLLGGQLVIPAKAIDAGFVWRHATLESALIDLLAPDSGRKPAVETFAAQQYVRAPLRDVVSFFEDASSLARLTPPAMRCRLTTKAPGRMRRGLVVDYDLVVHGFALRWRALIVQWLPGIGFTDVQVRGPYSLWRHTHEFEEKDGGVVVRDRVEYNLPLAPLSNLALPLVRRDIESIFAFRRRAMEDIFAS